MALWTLPASGALATARSRAHPWAFGATVAIAAMAVRVAMQPLLGDALPFLLAFPAIVLVSLRCGIGPGALAAFICGLWVCIPGLAPSVAPDEMPVLLAGYAVSALVTTLVCAQFGAPGARAQEPAAHADLETADTPLTRWLRAVVWGAALIPLAAFAGACWWGYQKAFSDADLTVRRVNRVVAQHALRTLATASEVAAKTQELVAMPDAEVRANEALIHQRLKDIAIGLPAVLAMSAWDENGNGLVNSQKFPMGARVSIVDRDYFRQVRSADPGFFISNLVTGRVTNQRAFNVVVRRKTPDGRFAGAIVVTLMPSYFQDFYRSLATEDPGLNTFALFRDDGALLTRWPPAPEGMTQVPETSPLLAPARAGQPHGVLYIRSSFDAEPRLISFERLGGLPVYVTAALGEPAILAAWYRYVALLSAILLPTTAVLVYVSWLALQKTRREEAALARLRGEMRRRTQAEAALLQSQKLEAIGQLTGGVAHDFNNLLAIVSNNVYVIERRHPEVASGPHLTAIARAVASGVNLTRQLLSFARKQALKPEVIRLQEWLPGAIELLRTTLGRAIALQLEVDPELPPILVDTAEFELALINLAVNAKDAMPQGGVLRIAAGRQAPTRDGELAMIAVRVTDNGTGIAPEILGKVFEPFFTTKPSGLGSGLGLSQVYGLCVQAGGVAMVESAAGDGTTVSMLFPAAATPAPLPAPAALIAPHRLSGHVLIVEDNDELANAQATLLKSAGLGVDRVASAQAALARLGAPGARIDVVLSDISMPGKMDGIQLAFRLRETLPLLPVILTTGYAARVHEAIDAGFLVLAKPSAPAELFRELERALARGQASPPPEPEQPADGAASAHRPA